MTERFARPLPLPGALLLAAILVVFPGLPGSGASLAAQESPPPATHAEITDWEELTPHTEVVAFYEELSALSSHVRLHRFGESAEGRSLLGVTIARPAVADPWEAHGSGKAVVLINAQVHGDEPAGKEALMLFARDLAVGPLAPLLDNVIFVFSPQLNPDGAESGDWGSRSNQRGMNVNRDYLRLENPETRAFVERIVAAWSPHVVVDAHELVGPPRIYDFYTSFPRDFTGADHNFQLTRTEVVPAIVDALEEAGFDHFPYHRVPSGLVDDPSIGVSAGTYGARALSSYGGAHAAVTLLYESVRPRDARVGLEDRTRRHHVAMTALAEYVAENRQKVLDTVEAERQELVERGARWDPADSIAVRLQEVPSREEDYRMQWEDEVVELRVPILDSAVVELGRVRPVGYLIEPHRVELARHLARHGLQVHRLEEGTRLAAESFEVDSLSRGSQPYEGYVERELWTTTRETELDARAGSFVVRADQPNARILFHLMEPEDVNSLVSMGWLATEERDGTVLSIHRLRELPSVPTEVVTRTDRHNAPVWKMATPTPEVVPALDASLRTYAERLGWRALTPAEEVVGFMRHMTARTPYGWMTEIGRTREGRPMHLATFSRPAVRTPWEAHASGKPILFIGASVHGDEPAGKEAVQLFVRDLVEGPLDYLLDEVVFLFVPQLNPDGGEAGTWGIRSNVAGYNLNRDWLRLDNPETRVVVEEVFAPWRPHVAVDAHELGGPPRVYDFYTWHPTNPHGPRAPVDLAAESLVPGIVEALEDAGYSHIIYHTPGGLNRIVQEPETGIHVPVYGRTMNDYAGGLGMATILFESLRERDARVNIQDRANRQHVAMRALAERMAEEAERVTTAFRDGRGEMAERGLRWDPADSIAIRREPVPSRTVEYQVAEVRETDTGTEFTGETVTVEVPVYDSSRVTLGRTRPVGYLIERHRGDLVRHLLTHGLQVEEVLRDASWPVESFQVGSLALSSSVYEGYVPQTFETTLESRSVEIPAGAYFVRASQPAAGLVFHLMEPEDENSFAITGQFLSQARPDRYLEVHRVREIPDVPLRRVDPHFRDGPP